MVNAIFSRDSQHVLTASVDRTAKAQRVRALNPLPLDSRESPPGLGYPNGRVCEVPAAATRCGSSQSLFGMRTLTLAGEVVVSVFSTEQRNLALSTLQDGTAKFWRLGSQPELSPHSRTSCSQLRLLKAQERFYRGVLIQFEGPPHLHYLSSSADKMS